MRGSWAPLPPREHGQAQGVGPRLVQPRHVQPCQLNDHQSLAGWQARERRRNRHGLAAPAP